MPTALQSSPDPRDKKDNEKGGDSPLRPTLSQKPLPWGPLSASLGGTETNRTSALGPERQILTTFPPKTAKQGLWGPRQGRGIDSQRTTVCANYGRGNSATQSRSVQSAALTGNPEDAPAPGSPASVTPAAATRLPTPRRV